MRVWIDVENPPQVQYLLPLRPAFEKVGAEVIVTARDYGNTFELLEQAAVPFSPIGTSYGAAKWRKAAGLAGRTRQLVRHLRRTGRPDASVSASRAAAVAGRLLRHPSFVIIDYEHVFLGVQRLTRSYVLYPDVIEASAFREKGIRDRELLPFRGLKEDLSFAHMNTESEDAHYLPIADDRLVRVLVRPAAEESHYYREESGYMTLDLLERLAGEDRAVVVFSPRYPRQAEYLERFEWRNKPLVLDRAVPFVSLLKAVDVVVSSGGTMLREAAYLGVPAYSTFQGDVGAVDRHLESLGRLHLISSRADFDRISLSKATPLAPLDSNPQLVDELAQQVIATIQGASPDG